MTTGAVDWETIVGAPDVGALIDLAISEDLGDGDVTSLAVFSRSDHARFALRARRETVVCGTQLIAPIVRRIGGEVDIDLHRNDGQVVKAGETIGFLSGDVVTILSAERVVLNFMMRLSGIAGLSRRAVARVPQGCAAKIFDTRKTTPGWRRLEKAAVAVGGACNHRFGLFDQVLIKDNHIAAAGGVGAAIARARAYVREHAATYGDLLVEVEVDDLEQLAEAIAGGPDIILLDNFEIECLRVAVDRRDRLGSGILLEASGGVNLDSIAEIAGSGVERISMGALTHSAVPADLGLDAVED